ncbi:unnamed protein product [Dracunculus medinensis]|uniref:Secreted protein n=1 Tax=Dracunculus medinensis TaxID=318479 RepID=A0A0N4U0M7_DRAME|nr:unnamed protein product [Dracunculus medinensis]
MAKDFFYHFRKRFSLYIAPFTVLSIILLDWNHTREWKKNDRKSLLLELIKDTHRDDD